MKVLIDTDIFCKLAAANLLSDAVALFEADLADCGRLPALPYMLKKGSVAKQVDQGSRETLLETSKSVPAIVGTGNEWLDTLAPYSDINVGEAQLFAHAAEFGCVLMTGDKRALRTLKEIPLLCQKLAGLVAPLEALLLALCDRLGIEEMRRRLPPAMSMDTVVQICFGGADIDPRLGLHSYLQSLTTEVAPLVFWRPTGGSRA
jgi:hypothetical protein